MPEGEDAARNIRVAVRCRPMSSKEVGNKERPIFEVSSGNAVLRDAPKGDHKTEHEFNFDHVYGDNTEQINVYKDIGEPLLLAAFEGLQSQLDSVDAEVESLCDACGSIASRLQDARASTQVLLAQTARLVQRATRADLVVPFHHVRIDTARGIR